MPSHPTVASLSAAWLRAPGDLNAALTLAQAHWARLDFGSALRHLTQVAAAFPASADPWTLSGDILTEAGRESEANAHYARALEIDPANFYACLNAGQTALATGSLETAEAYFRRLCALRPLAMDGYRGLARVVLATSPENDPTALVPTMAGVDAPPGAVDSGVGRALFEVGRYDEASRILARQVTCQSDDWTALMNLGRCQEFLADYAAAGATFSRGLATPRPLTELVRAYIEHLVRVDDLPAASRLYRVIHAHSPANATIPPDWRGESLAGRTIVITNAGGLGDSIQFVRFAGLLKQMGARTIVECQPQLVDLLSTYSGADAVVSPYAEHDPADYSTPAQFLPLLIDWDWRQLGENMPFLHAPADLVQQRWRQHRATGRLRVGVAWQGSPLWRDDPARQRSFPLRALSPLAGAAGVSIYSLQYGVSRAELDNAGFPITAIASAGFLATAASIATLDVVVANDSAVAHLAGAMGKPCFLLLPRSADWRWMTHESQTHYYPSMRLFRQQEPGDWTAPIAAAAQALRPMAATANA